jgi:hypothetical protein
VAATASSQRLVGTAKGMAASEATSVSTVMASCVDWAFESLPDRPVKTVRCEHDDCIASERR